MRNALAVVLLLLTGCGGDTPTASTPVAVTSPTPPPKEDPNSCVQADAKVFAYNGAGNTDVVFDYREPIDVRVKAVNAAGVILTDKCSLPRVAGWSSAGPCIPFGDLTSPEILFFCQGPGTLDVTVTYGGYKAIGRFLLLR